MKHGQLFGGIFGFGLAAQWAGIENVWYNDNDHFCCEVVRARIKDGQIKDKVEIYEKDIKEIGKHNLKRVDIISAGVPCQPASISGKRKGKSDDRWQWGETIRVVSELKPLYVICENPSGILNLEDGKPFNEILYALENEGYTIELFDIPACSKGAWHRRSRIWIIAYFDTSRDQRKAGKDEGEGNKKQVQEWNEMEQLTQSNKLRISTNTPGKRLQRWELSKKGQSQRQPGRPYREFGGWEVEPGVVRVVHGLSAKLVKDRRKRIKALGNSVVPQVAYELFKAIKQIG